MHPWIQVRLPLRSHRVIHLHRIPNPATAPELPDGNCDSTYKINIFVTDGQNSSIKYRVSLCPTAVRCLAVHGLQLVTNSLGSLCIIQERLQSCKSCMRLLLIKLFKLKMFDTALLRLLSVECERH